jgi:NADPH-dependent curcumin reductase CurA
MKEDPSKQQKQNNYNEKMYLCQHAHDTWKLVAKVEPEQTVFINGGSSATGAFTIQIAKAKGARVMATAFAKNKQVIQNLGADEVLLSSSTQSKRFLCFVLRDHSPDMTQLVPQIQTSCTGCVFASIVTPI